MYLELIYIWCAKYRTYIGQEMNFGRDCEVKFDSRKYEIEITEKPTNNFMYPKYITNINAIVGINGTGKTNLVHLIGEKLSNRYNNENIESYFMIYKMHGTNKYIIEFKQTIKREIEKIFIKPFSAGTVGYSICEYDAELKKFRCDNIDQDEIASIIAYEESKNMYIYQNPLNIQRSTYDINMKINRIIYAYNNANVISKVKTIYDYMQNENRGLYKEKKYELKISRYYMSTTINNRYNNPIYKYKNFLEDELDEKEKIMRLYIQDFVISCITSAISGIDVNKKESMEELKHQFKKCDDISDFWKYNEKLLNITLDYTMKVLHKNETEKQIKDKEIKMNYLKKIKEVFLKKNYDISKSQDDESIYFYISKNCNLNKIIEFCEAVYGDIEYNISTGGYNLPYEINYLSGGEETYLGIFATLQYRIQQTDNDSYIIIYDEPENKMHPNMSREFIKNFMKFIEDMGYTNKKFQLIIATHSPFILSDIYSKNVIYLQKENGHTKVSKNIVKNTFSSNVYELLANSFFMKYTIGEYAREKILEIVDYLQGSQKKEIEVLRQYKEIVENIGEPVIREDLEKMILKYMERR